LQYISGSAERRNVFVGSEFRWASVIYPLRYVIRVGFHEVGLLPVMRKYPSRFHCTTKARVTHLWGIVEAVCK
jgi:hypothetical protein